MKISYIVTKEDYLQTIIYALKERRKTPVNIIIFLMMTVVQLCAAIWAAVKYSGQSSAVLWLPVLSIGICALPVFYQLSVTIRARAQMNRDIRKGNISKDFWNRQYVTLENQIFRLKCGKNELVYDCAYFNGAQSIGGILLLSFKKEKAVHQIMVPLSALESMGGGEGLTKLLTEAKRESLGISSDEGNARPLDAVYFVSFIYSEKEFYGDQIRAARLAYTNRVGWTFANIAKIIAAAFLIYHIFMGSYGSTGFLVFIIIVIILLIYPIVITFSPLCGLLIRNNIRSLFGALSMQNCALDIAEGKLFYTGETFRNVIPLSYVYSVASGKNLTVIYLKDNSAITIPYSASENHNTYKLTTFLEQIADANWKNRSTKEKLR